MQKEKVDGIGEPGNLKSPPLETVGRIDILTGVIRQDLPVFISRDDSCAFIFFMEHFEIDRDMIVRCCVNRESVFRRFFT